MRFYIVDVFAERKYSGNQLAVFRDSGRLPGTTMQRIASEMHYSETTFITSERLSRGGYDVRVFTPGAEIPFAGHPTLGTAFIVQSEIIGEQVPAVNLNMKVGQIPVTFSYRNGKADILWMRQKEPEFGVELDSGATVKALGLRASDLDGDLPVMEVSTGLPFVIVPLRSLEAARRARLDESMFLRVMERAGLPKRKAEGVLVFSPETYRKENDLNVRVFVPGVGVPEDPATGSGNGCLAAYLVRNRFRGRDHVELRVEQGYEIGRKSLLLLKAGSEGGRIQVNVGGKVQFVGKGEFP